MGRTKVISSSDVERNYKPARTPEARENQMIALAVDLAEKQLREGTASSQVITHYLKLGSTKEKLEKEEKVEQVKLLRAKTEMIQSQKKMEETYADALRALRGYQGLPEESIDEDF